MRITNSCNLSGGYFNHPADISINKCLEDLIEDNEDLKDSVALVNSETGREVTYKELNEKANKMARVLLNNIKSNNTNPNSDGDYIIALRFVPSEELVITLLAIFKAGLAYVPIAPNWPEGRIKHVIEDSAPVLIITNQDRADLLYTAQADLPILKKREVVFYEELAEESGNYSGKNLPTNQTMQQSVSPGSRLYSILYTSGSTGLPKGVKHVHSAALNRFHWQWRLWPYARDEVCVFKTTLTFVDSVTEIWSPLLCGKKLVIFPTRVTQNVEKFVEYLDRYQIGRIFVVTSLVRSILSYLKISGGSKKKSLQSVKIWECSAETVTKDVLLAFYEYFPPGTVISNFYGSTEMMDVTFETFTSAEEVKAVLFEDKIPIGVPVDNSKAYVLDDDLNLVPDGIIGSLYVSSRNLGRGYCGGKQGGFLPNHLSDNSDEGQLYKTGDYVQVRGGRLYYEGRLDSQVKVRGHRVDLTEVETAVREMKEINNTVVLCYKPGQPGQKLLCYFTTTEGARLTEKKVESFIAEKLPDYMLPKLTKLATMPLLVNGKIDRQALFQRYEDSIASNKFSFSESDMAEFVGPELYNEARVRVCVDLGDDESWTVVRSVLESVSMVCGGDNKPSLADNFFSLGGDSINMVQVVGLLQEAGYHITLTSFVASSSLLDIVKSLSNQPIFEEDLTNMMSCLDSSSYTSRELGEEDKEVVMDMISRSFADKGDLTTIASVSYDNIREQMVILWQSIQTAGLSLVILNNNNEVIGSCINFDARSEEAAPLCATAAFTRDLTEEERREQRRQRRSLRNDQEEEEVPMTVVDFLEAVEHPLKDKYLPQDKGQYIYTSMLGTAKDLPTSENVKVALFLEKENIRHAKKKGFKGIFTTNANRLTQLISRSLEYQILSTVYVNQYEDDQGNRPFASASDDLVCEVAIKTF